jgi:hypothetical protein
MALIPSKPEYKVKLKEMGVSGYVYPLDEALGLTSLPFKLTVGAMLEVAKESTRCESYEDAESILLEKIGVKINDDTMRQVTNTIGSIVYNNDVNAAEKLWKEMGKIRSSKFKSNHTLYLEVDGAMLPTRQENIKGSVYKENKLGMAFSTDNIYWWKDKNGDRQHRILKKEFTSLIGDSDSFTKLMLLLAIKNGYGNYKNTVLISDGATWIRSMKDFIFPDAQQILDFYHLKEHITNYFKKIYNFNENK